MRYQQQRRSKYVAQVQRANPLLLISFMMVQIGMRPQGQRTYKYMAGKDKKKKNPKKRKRKQQNRRLKRREHIKWQDLMRAI